jgi:U3 small nucleolar RNA-associated protein 18
VKRWKDEGGYRGAGRVLAGSGGVGGSGWMAIGSTSGFVNVYDSDSFSVHRGDTESGTPKPVKALGHLTTPISTLRFNHDAQILAMASKDKRDAMRLIHLPSLTSFDNWPTSSTPLGHVTAVDFSARSEYVAIGNTRGRVLLYHLKEYGFGR